MLTVEDNVSNDELKELVSLNDIKKLIMQGNKTIHDGTLESESLSCVEYIDISFSDKSRISVDGLLKMPNLKNVRITCNSNFKFEDVELLENKGIKVEHEFYPPTSMW